MEKNYFFTACSNAFMLNLDFYISDDKDKVFLNLKFNFGDGSHDFSCESVGYCLRFDEVVTFRSEIGAESFDASLRDVEGSCLFAIAKSQEGIIVTHSKKTGAEESDDFLVKFNVTDDFVNELASGLHEWVFSK